MSLQEKLQARVKEIIFKERETQPKGFTVVRRDIKYNIDLQEWVLELFLQNDEKWYVCSPYKNVIL